MASESISCCALEPIIIIQRYSVWLLQHRIVFFFYICHHLPSALLPLFPFIFAIHRYKHARISAPIHSCSIQKCTISMSTNLVLHVDKRKKKVCRRPQGTLSLLSAKKHNFSLLFIFIYNKRIIFYFIACCLCRIYARLRATNAPH